MVSKRRVVGLVGAVALVAGCSSSDDDADEAPSTSAPPQAEQQPPQEIAAGADGFYDVPDPLPAGEHGDLVRYQEADSPPEGVRWYRVLCLSEKVDGDPTVVTGTIVIPQGEAPDGGWPVVSHAHGGNGIADDCSPSRALGGQDFSAVEIGLVSTMAASSGAIVVSSDYEGLGGPGEHPYLNGQSEGRGVLDIARAVPNFRHPVTLAKDLVALDAISEGRVTVGLGAGSAGRDATVLGRSPWSPAERAEHFEEFVTLLDQLLTHDETTFTGKHYAADQATMRPGCAQQPRLPFTIAANGPRGMRLAARYGQAWVTCPFADPGHAPTP